MHTTILTDFLLHKAGCTMHRHGFGIPSTSAHADGDHGTVVSARWFRQPHLHPNADDAEIKKRNFLNQTVGMRFFNDEVALMENGWRFLCYASFGIDLVWREKLMWRWCGTDGEWMEICVLLMALCNLYFTPFELCNYLLYIF